jgi:hypothetical protein
MLRCQTIFVRDAGVAASATPAMQGDAACSYVTKGQGRPLIPLSVDLPVCVTAG